MSSLFKPCPHCGKQESVGVVRWSDEHEYYPDSGEEDSYAINCNFNQKGCGATGGYRITLEDAAVAWNKRAGD